MCVIPYVSHIITIPSGLLRRRSEGVNTRRVCIIISCVTLLPKKGGRLGVHAQARIRTHPHAYMRIHVRTRVYKGGVF